MSKGKIKIFSDIQILRGLLPERANKQCNIKRQKWKLKGISGQEGAKASYETGKDILQIYHNNIDDIWRAI